VRYTKFNTASTVKVVHDDAVETGSQADGTIVHVQNRIDEFGEYSTAKLTDTANAADSGEYTSSAGEFSDIASQQYVNQTSIPNASDTTNTEQTVRGKINAYGRWDYVKNTTTSTLPAGQSWTVYDKSFYWDYTIVSDAITVRTRRVRGWNHILNFYDSMVDAYGGIGALGGDPYSIRVYNVAPKLWALHGVLKGNDQDAGW